MTEISANQLERSIVRYGDALYRLALLLSSDRAIAARSLLDAVRRLAAEAPATVDEATLIGALAAALPPMSHTSHTRGVPSWAAHSPQSSLLAPLAGLQREQVLVLGALASFRR